MTKAEKALLKRVQARVRRMQPGLAKALLESLERVRDLLTERDLRDVLNGRVSIDTLLSEALIARAFRPYQTAIRKAVEEGVRLTLPDLRVPGASVSVLFDVLNPNVITAIRELESTAMDTLTDNVREVTRAFAENGIRDGVHPREVARQLRNVIGMAPHQADFVDNYEEELRTLDPKALDRELTDGRFDSKVRKAITSGVPLTEAEILQGVEIYRKNFAIHNTTVVTRQVTLDSYRTGRRLAWHGAVEQGFIEPDELWRTWVHFDPQKNPRPAHQRKDGETVRFDEPYSDGTYVAGIGAWGCHCSDRYSTRRATVALRPTRELLSL